MKANKNETNLLDSLLSEIPQSEYLKTEKHMRLASVLSNALKLNNMSKKELASKLGYKSQSNITKYLSGSHNFTIDKIFDLEEALNIKIVDLDRLESNHSAQIFQASKISNTNSDGNFDFTYLLESSQTVGQFSHSTIGEEL